MIDETKPSFINLSNKLCKREVSLIFCCISLSSEYIWILDCWSEKTHLKMSTCDLGNCECSFSEKIKKYIHERTLAGRVKREFALTQNQGNSGIQE